MWVYGDAERSQAPQAFAARLAETMQQGMSLPHGLARHAALVRVFVDASELIQGLTDHAFHQRGFDAATADQQPMADLLRELAARVDRSWRSRFSEQDIRSGLVSDLAELGLGHETALTTRSAEGYSIYALYPETYLDGARASGLPASTIVIGIRSIGLSLAALVAAALDAQAPISLRPIGDPFARRVETDPALLAGIVATDAPIAIVDEGPGLSGSSFFAVADWLEGGGVARNRIHFFPSHTGEPGAQASPDHKARWRDAPRHVRGFDATLLQDHRLETWISDAVGPLSEPLRDISGGGWRSGGDNKIPVDSRLERCKFLACTANGRFLVKFAGLGSDGARKFETARALFAAGFAPEPVALVHGMLLERWIDSAESPDAVDRTALVGTLGHYLGFRAQQLAAHNKGAPLSLLADVAAYNSGRAFGPLLEDGVRQLTQDAAALQPIVHLVDTDNRLHRWEWLTLPDGQLIKTDALDHSSSHDLVGCQDIAWDLAGAIVEQDLSEDEAAIVAEEIARASGRAPDAKLTALLIPCYIGFQVGLWVMARDAAAEADKPAISSLLARYEHKLRMLVES